MKNSPPNHTIGDYADEIIEQHGFGEDITFVLSRELRGFRVTPETDQQAVQLVNIIRIKLCDELIAIVDETEEVLPESERTNVKVLSEDPGLAPTEKIRLAASRVRYIRLLLERLVMGDKETERPAQNEKAS